jgi:hypothetical protein
VKKSIEVSRALRAMQPEETIESVTEEEPASGDEESPPEAT